MKPVQLFDRLLVSVVCLLFAECASIAQNHNPEVRIVSPANGSVYTAPTNLLVIANAEDVDGYLTISRVEFFDNGVSLGIRTNYPSLDPIGPFFVDWPNVPVGTHVLTARVWDTNGASGLSDEVTITVGMSSPIPGVLKREVYLNIPGMEVANLVNHEKFPGHPDIVGTVSGFEAPTQFGDNYGQRLTGYLRPPVTGEYRFYVASDDQSELYLSTGPDPAARRLIARELMWNMPRNWNAPGEGRVSEPIHLEAGKYYYVEALHKEGPGGDNFAVAWQLPGAPVPENGSPPIAGEYLAISPPHTNDLPPAVAIQQPMNNTAFEAGTSVPIIVRASDKETPVLTVKVYANDAHIANATQADSDPMKYIASWVNAAAGTYQLRAVATDSGGLSSTSAVVNVSIRAKDTTDRELHVVGVYSGDVNGQPSQNNERGVASVTVDRPGKRVTLFLSAYEPVRWVLSATPGTTIEKVIVSGFYQQLVEGAPAGAEVVSMWCESQPTPCLYIGYSLESAAFYRAVPKLKSLTGLEIASFRGDYKAPYPAPYLINEIQNDVRLRSDYPQPVAPAELPTNLNFTLNFYNGSVPGSGSVSSQSYTLGGPSGGGELLPGIRVVGDRANNYYSAGRHQVFRMNGATGQAVEMEIALSSHLPELSWPMGMAYDPVGDRVLLVSLGGEGHLYAYDPDERAWSLVSSMHNFDLDSIVYHQPQNAIYGFEVYRGDYRNPRVLKFDAAGNHLGEITLHVLPVDIGVSGYESELVSVGNYLVLLIAPEQPHWDTPSDSRMYLIDPRTGQFWLTYRNTGPANQPPTATVTAPVAGAILPPAAPVELVARAKDNDGQVQTVEFFLDGSSLGNGQRIEGSDFYRKVWSNPILGTHHIFAKATDDDLATSVSATVAVTVSNVGTNTNNVPDLAFELTFFSSFDPGQGFLFHKQYTLRGSRQPGNLLPGMRLSPPGGQRYLYAAYPHHVLRVDVVSSTAEEMEITQPGLPEVSWPMGMTFDTMRNRALLVTLGGEGYLYSYRPADNIWSVVSSMHDLDLDSIVYHRPNDSIYGFGGFAGGGNRVLYRFNANGEKAGELILPAIDPLFVPFEYQSELVSVENYLVLIVAPNLIRSTRPEVAENRMYVIDPNTGQSWLTYRQVELPNTAPEVAITSPTNGAVLPAGIRMTLSATATDQEGNVATVEFQVNGVRLGLGTSRTGTLFNFVWANPPVGQHVLTAKAIDANGLTAVSPPIHVTVGTVPPPPGFAVRSFAGNVVTLAAAPGSGVRAYAVEDTIPVDFSVSHISHDGVFDAANRKVKFGPYFDNSPRQLTYTVIPPQGITGTAEFHGVASADGVSSPVTGQCCWSPVLYHPADNNPADWRMTINEMSAYASAWKRGDIWAGPPSPIPMDYVTRAAALWRGGEQYIYDPRFAPPLCWRSVLVPVPVSKSTESSTMVMRRASEVAVPGQPVKVILDVAAGSSQAYAIEESVPPGYRLVKATHEGAYDQANRTIKWGPFLDSSRRTIEYELVSAEITGVDIFFSGRASFEGVSVDIAGSSLARVGSRLIVHPAGTGTLAVHVDGTAGADWVIETSTDLKNWATTGPVTSSGDTIQIPVSAEVGAVPKYYRARQLR